MKKNILKFAVLALMLLENVFAVSPLVVQAIDCGPGLYQDPATKACVTPPAGPGFFRTASIAELIIKIVNVLLGIGAVVAVLYIVIGGFRYITSSGNEKAAETGRQTVVNAIIGLVLIILAYVIVRVVNQTLSRS